MELLTTKIIALTLLGSLSLFFGLLPLRVRKYLTQGSKKRERITSYMLCFGGGVLLATIFIHMLPETRVNFTAAFANKYLTWGEDYPMAELVVCAGFFFIYMVEELVHQLTKDTGSDDEKNSSHPHHHHHHHHHRHHSHRHNAHKLETIESGKQPRRESGRCSVYSITEAVKKSSVEGAAPDALTLKNKWAESGVDNPVFAGDVDATTWNPALKDAIVTSSQVMPSSNQTTTVVSDSDGAGDNGVSHNTTTTSVGSHNPNGNVGSHNNNNNHSHNAAAHNSEGGHSHIDLTKLCAKGISGNLRSVIIILALSIHSVFEGLAVGLQERVVDVWYLFGAISAHKFVIAFCMGIKFLTAMPAGLMVIYMVIFALVSPLGVAIGILVTENVSGDPGTHLVFVTILQGLAGGTILYVTFFEILERERARDGGRLLKLLFLFIGFAIMASIEAIGGHSHGPIGKEGGHAGHSHGSHAGHGHDHDSHAGHDHAAFVSSPPLADLKANSPHGEDRSLDVTMVPLADFTGDINHEGHDHTGDNHHEGHDHTDHDHHEGHADDLEVTTDPQTDDMRDEFHEGHDHGLDVTLPPSSDLQGGETHDDHLRRVHHTDDHDHDHDHDHSHHHPEH